jgi:hypothetical protein
MATPEIGGEHLDSHLRPAPANGLHGGGEESGAMVGQVVAGHGGEHDVAQSEGLHRLGHPLRLPGVEGHRRPPLLHLTEGTAAGADRPPQQEGGGSSGVALPTVGAAALLADGVEPLPLHHRLHRFEGRGGAEGLPDPFGQPLAGGNGAERLVRGLMAA